MLFVLHMWLRSMQYKKLEGLQYIWHVLAYTHVLVICMYQSMASEQTCLLCVRENESEEQMALL